MELLDPSDEPEGRHVSTGNLPPSDRVRRLVDEAHARFGSVTAGSGVAGLPGAGAGARRPVRHLRGRHRRQRLRRRRRRSSVRADERVQAHRVRAGLRPIGPTRRARTAGGERDRLCPSTRSPASSARRRAHQPDGECRGDRDHEPRPGTNVGERWRFIHDGLSRFAGRTLSLDEEVYASAIETNFRNRGLVWMLESHGRIYCDPAEALDLYTRQCSLT